MTDKITFDTTLFYEQMEAMNKRMEDIKREFKLKNMASEISASKVVLNARIKKIVTDIK